MREPSAEMLQAFADGVDLFSFKDGLIIAKCVYRKDRPRLPPLPPASAAPGTAGS